MKDPRRTSEELRQSIAEAHALLRDLRRERRNLKMLIRDVPAMIVSSITNAISSSDGLREEADDLRDNSLAGETGTGNVSALRQEGYGFIRTPQAQGDVFFHRSDLVGYEFDDLLLGAEVTFTLSSGTKGLAAKNLRVVDGPSWTQ